MQPNSGPSRDGRRMRPRSAVRAARRLLALAAVYDGATRTAAAAIGGVTLPSRRRSAQGATGMRS